MAGKNLESDVKLKEDCAQWLRSVMSLMPQGVEHPNAVTTSSFTNRRENTRDIMAQRLNAVVKIVQRQIQYVDRLENVNQQLKSDMIGKQERVIELQEALIAAKEVQMVELRDTVVTSVSDTVKNQIKSYSEAVQEAGNLAGGSLVDQNTLKTVVKDVVAEEDRSKNLFVFGLIEDPTEQTSDKVGKVFEALGVKPKVEAIRIGSKLKKQAPRPVKVSVSNSTIVTQILTKASNLRNFDQYKQVFISPDRTPEQRAAHRELIEQLKLKRTNEPNSRHYIKGGQIFSADKIVGSNKDKK